MADLAQNRPPSRDGPGRDGREAGFVSGPSRRGFLALAGGGVAAVAVGGAVAGDAYAVQRGVFASSSGPAYAPWRDWDAGVPPLQLVRAAVLAANAHNAQAWRFAVAADRIDVYDDTARSLGAVDAYRREIQLSGGCAVENLVVAARAAGLVPAVTLVPTGDPALLARVDLAQGPAAPSDLYRAIPHRHTDRGAYHPDRPLPAGVAAAMDALGDQAQVRVLWLLGAADRASFSALTVSATQAFIADPQQSRDDYAWYRGTWQQLQAHRDGVTVDASGLSPVVRALAN